MLVVGAVFGADGRTFSHHRLETFQGQQVVGKVDIGEIRASHSFADVSGVAWAPDGFRYAVLLENQRVGILEGGRARGFDAPAPPIPPSVDARSPGDLLWVGSTIVRIAPYFISLWSRPRSVEPPRHRR